MNSKKALAEPDGQAQADTGMRVGPAVNQTEPDSEPTPPPATGRPLREELTPLQLAGIHALLTRPTMTAAAQEIGAHPRTMSRWMKEPAFRTEYLAQTTELRAELWRQMLSVRKEVWNRYLELMRSNDEKVALRATTWFLDKVLSAPPMLDQFSVEDDELGPPSSLRSLLREAVDAKG